MPGFLASRGEEINLGPMMRLDCSELLCNKVLLKYKLESRLLGEISMTSDMHMTPPL